MWFWRLRATSAADFLIRAMEFGPVVHVMTNPLECAIRPVPHIYLEGTKHQKSIATNITAPWSCSRML